jgi:hypothetical protein
MSKKKSVHLGHFMHHQFNATAASAEIDKTRNWIMRGNLP